MRKNNLHTRRETGRPSNLIKPTLLALAIAQALAFQAVHAASIEVTSNLDEGTDCTLREAIDTVNAGVDQNNGCIINGALGTADAIGFGAGVAGSTIVTNGELAITQNVSINSGGVNTTIDANGIERVIGISSSTVELDQLTLTGGFQTDASFKTSMGGGIYASYSTVTLSNSTVSGNSATGDGGGIYAKRSTATLNNSTVSDNTVSFEGGGIKANRGSTVTLTNSTVSGNSAGYGQGGGIYVRGADVTLTNSTVSGNSATGRGGGIYVREGRSSLTNSTVSGNSAGIYGGGIYASAFGFTTLINSTVSGNSAGSNGGGIFIRFIPFLAPPESTDPGNSAGTGGGGTSAGFYPVTLINSIIANSLGADCSSFGDFIGATADSIIEDGSCGTAASTVDPVLGPLADNGGPTQTHALLAGSPAIENGTGAGATASDQRGVAAEGVRDSGAYEFTGAMNALTIEKLINHRDRGTLSTAAQLLAGTRYRAEYKVTNNSPKRLYPVQVFEGNQLVCNLYALDSGESKQPYRCASNQAVLVGSNNVPATVTAKVSGSNQALAGQSNAYYTGFSNVPGKLNVRHYVNNRNADTQAKAVLVNGDQAEVLFRVENTGSIELYRVNTYHDPASPVNSGWQQQCFIGALDPGQVRYCKRTVSVMHEGLNKAFGRAQGSNANVSATGFVNASNPTYFNVVLD